MVNAGYYNCMYMRLGMHVLTFVMWYTDALRVYSVCFNVEHESESGNSRTCPVLDARQGVFNARYIVTRQEKGSGHARLESVHMAEYRRILVTEFC